MTQASMTIDGELRSGGRTFDVLNPALDEVHGQAPDCTPEQLDEALEAASRALPRWQADLDARRLALRTAAERLFGAAAELAPLLTAEQGKPLAPAEEEVAGAAVWFQYFSDLELSSEVIQDDERARVEVVRRPLGVVAAITPWNYPLILAAWKLAPALLAGNTVVLKPSPYTPLSTLAMAQLLNDVFPPGVLNVVTGGDQLGAWMTGHPIPRKVSITGSIATGKLVAAAAAPDLKRVTLELGGNDAAIVLDDADPEAIADQVFAGAFTNNGQVCSAIKRVFVADSLHDELVEALGERARAAVVGDPTDPATELGPINNAPQLARVEALVDRAVAAGGSAVTGGSRLDQPGYFFPPTIVTGVSEGVRLVDEEQFGPALPILTFGDPAEAVERANSGHFGLSGSVWGTDVDRAAALASGLECGTVWVNSHLALAPHQPFGGFKWSGIGVENGPWGLDSFSQIQTQYRTKQ